VATPKFLPFAQLDLPGRIILDDGRYLARAAQPAGEDDVIVIRTLGVQRAKRRLRKGRPVPIEEPGEATLPLTRVTVVKALPFASEAEAEQWLAELSSERERQTALANEAIILLNEAIHAHAVAANYPYASDVGGNSAVSLRFGYGLGDEVVEGSWTAARQPDEGERVKLLDRDLGSVGAQERVAEVLGRRGSILAAETLLLRTRADIEQRRFAAAALGVEAALSAVGESTDPALLAELREQARELGRAARADRLGPGDETALRKLIGAGTRLISPRH